MRKKYGSFDSMSTRKVVLGSAGGRHLARLLWTLIATGQPGDKTKAFDHRPSTLSRHLR